MKPLRLLLTGFEPFGGSRLNPSQQVALALHEAGLPGIELHTAILPVERLGGPRALLEAITAVRPQAVLCLGEATRRAVLSIERVGINLQDYRIADNAGNQVEDQPVGADGPAAYFATLPVRAMLQAVLAAGVPAELSLSAGAFLCNQVLYTALHFIHTRRLAMQAGFIHLPSLPEQALNASPFMPSMSLETSLKGVTAALLAVRDQA